jgi:hypothetical protein
MRGLLRGGVFVNHQASDAQVRLEADSGIDLLRIVVRAKGSVNVVALPHSGEAGLRRPSEPERSATADGTD